MSHLKTISLTLKPLKSFKGLLCPFKFIAKLNNTIGLHSIISPNYKL